MKKEEITLTCGSEVYKLIRNKTIIFEHNLDAVAIITNFGSTHIIAKDLKTGAFERYGYNWLRASIRDGDCSILNNEKHVGIIKLLYT